MHGGVEAQNQEKSPPSLNLVRRLVCSLPTTWCWPWSLQNTQSVRTELGTHIDRRIQTSLHYFPVRGWSPHFWWWECASLTTRILHNSPLQSVTGVWNSRKKLREEIIVHILDLIELPTRVARWWWGNFTWTEQSPSWTLWHHKLRRWFITVISWWRFRFGGWSPSQPPSYTHGYSESTDRANIALVTGPTGLWPGHERPRLLPAPGKAPPFRSRVASRLLYAPVTSGIAQHHHSPTQTAVAVQRGSARASACRLRAALASLVLFDKREMVRFTVFSHADVCTGHLISSCCIDELPIYCRDFSEVSGNAFVFYWSVSYSRRMSEKFSLPPRWTSIPHGCCRSFPNTGVTAWVSIGAKFVMC